MTLLVERERFVDAVEVLRQNGLPRRKTVTMQELFPSGQLVTSPSRRKPNSTTLKASKLKRCLVAWMASLMPKSR
ncbi:hypothetical protein N4G58_18505 [Edwardsiella piscicida]|nr:hypothetical protein N4G58_18505 [Edwardsiella piscicida]